MLQYNFPTTARPHRDTPPCIATQPSQPFKPPSITIQNLYRDTAFTQAKLAFQTTMSQYNSHCIVTQLGSSPTNFCTVFFFLFFFTHIIIIIIFFHFFYWKSTKKKHIPIFFSHFPVTQINLLNFILFDFLHFYKL